MNPEQKMLTIYIENMHKTIEGLCKIINTLVSDDQVSFDAYEKVKQILGEIKYYQKFTNKQKTVSRQLSHCISVIESHSQHHPANQNLKEQYFPPVKTSRQLNLKSLATIAQKNSEQNLLQHYIRKQTKRKTQSKNIKTNYGNNKTINDPADYLNTSRYFQVIREETRRSLDNPAMQNRVKKPLYKQLEKLKGTEQMMPAVKDYLQKHNHKRQVVSRNPNYTITKFI